MSKKEKIRKFLYIIGIVSGGGLLIYQLISAIKAIPQTDFSQNAHYLIISSIFLSTFAIGMQIAGWYVIINSGVFTINFSSVVKGYSISFLPRYLPGTIFGYISRGEWLFQKYSIPFSMSNSISIWEIIATLTANVLIIFVYLINNFIPTYWITIIVLPLIPLLIHKLLVLLFSLLNRMEINIFGKLLRINSVPQKQWILCVLFFIFHWVFLGFALFQILASLGVDKISFLNVLFSGNLSWLSGFFVFFAPAGLGYREATLSYLLNDTFGVSAGIASIASSFFRLSTITAELLWILFGLLLERSLKGRLS